MPGPGPPGAGKWVQYRQDSAHNKAFLDTLGAY